MKILNNYKQRPHTFRSAKLPVTLDAGGGPNVFCKDQITSFLELQVTAASTETRTHDSYEKPLLFIVCFNIYVFVGRLTELLSVMVSGRLDIPAIFGCVIFDQLVQFFYQRTRSVELIDWTTVPLIRHYEGQRPSNILGLANAEGSNQTWRVPSKMWSTHRLCFLPISYVTTIAQTNKKANSSFHQGTPPGKIWNVA